jgi:hypothetical protein
MLDVSVPENVVTWTLPVVASTDTRPPENRQSLAPEPFAQSIPRKRESILRQLQ